MITFRRVDRTDFPRLLRWRQEPAVTQWWGPMTANQLEAEYGPHVDGDETTQFLIAAEDGREFGLIERYLNADHPDWDRQVQVPEAAGIDYFIGDPDLLDHGLGPRMIDAAVADLFASYPQARCVVVGVRIANPRSWRALEKAGFERLREQYLESEVEEDRGPGYLYIRRRP